MTKEEKQLLLVDLCARLPYGVICFAPDYEYGDIGKLWCIEPFEDLDPQITVQYPKGNTITKFCSEVKPYLRPMSSMTEEEEKTLKKIHHQFYNGNFIDAGVFSADDCGCTVFEMSNILRYLMSRNFDYCGLIEKGLALEAPEGMYKTE